MAMVVSNQRWCENYQEYLRLVVDRNYLGVTFDECSGGMSAIHCEHMFDKQIGPFGYRNLQIICIVEDSLLEMEKPTW